MSHEPDEGYRIAQVEQMTGVGTHTLRAWERRYGVPAPDRTGGRQRMYSMADIDLIRRMHQLSQQGVPLSRAAEIGRREAGEREGRGDGAAVVAGISSGLTGALLTWDEALASDVWTSAIDRLDLVTAFERVIIPAMREVGDAWHAGRITVAQEHFATNFVRARLDLLSRQVIPLREAPSVLFACLAGEHHEIGLLMLAVMCRFQGLRTIYLGQDVPDDALIRTAEDSQPEVLALNAGTVEGARRMPEIVGAVRAAAPLTDVVFGGWAFESDAALRAVDGAHYGGGDLQTAMALISRLGRAARPGGVK